VKHVNVLNNKSFSQAADRYYYFSGKKSSILWISDSLCLHWYGISRVKKKLSMYMTLSAVFTDYEAYVKTFFTLIFLVLPVTTKGILKWIVSQKRYFFIPNLSRAGNSEELCKSCKKTIPFDLKDVLFSQSAVVFPAFPLTSFQ